MSYQDNWKTYNALLTSGLVLKFLLPLFLSTSLIISPWELTAFAHHESGTDGVGASQLLEGPPNRQTGSPFSDSLWGNLLLSMAYQRDEEIKQISKHLGQIDLLTLTSVASVSGLGLAGGLRTLNCLNKSDTDPISPTILGIISSGATLGTVGVRTILTYRYRKKLRTRQVAIKNEIEQLLYAMEQERYTHSMHEQLKALVGERATREFEQIWVTSHSKYLAQVEK